MRTLPLTALCLSLGLASHARADQFHFSAPDAPEMEKRVVEGVLLSETETDYVIRVEGGEITVAKSMVKQIDKDDLTVAQLEEREKDAADQLAQANQRRRAILAQEAAGRAATREAVRAAEASMADAPAEVIPVAMPAAYGYDPVLDVARPMQNVLEQEIQSALGGELRRYVQRSTRELRRELRRAWRRR